MALSRPSEGIERRSSARFCRRATRQWYVGKAFNAPTSRNPISYGPDDADLAMLCMCGCGERIYAGYFLPGHDQRAIHARIARIGSVAQFITWFDDQFPPEDDLDIDVSA